MSDDWGLPSTESLLILRCCDGGGRTSLLLLTLKLTLPLILRGLRDCCSVCALCDVVCFSTGAVSSLSSDVESSEGAVVGGEGSTSQEALMSELSPPLLLSTTLCIAGEERAWVFCKGESAGGTGSEYDRRTDDSGIVAGAVVVVEDLSSDDVSTEESDA